MGWISTAWRWLAGSGRWLVGALVSLPIAAIAISWGQRWRSRALAAERQRDIASDALAISETTAHRLRAASRRERVERVANALELRKATARTREDVEAVTAHGSAAARWAEGFRIIEDRDGD